VLEAVRHRLARTDQHRFDQLRRNRTPHEPGVKVVTRRGDGARVVGEMAHEAPAVGAIKARRDERDVVAVVMRTEQVIENVVTQIIDRDRRWRLRGAAQAIEPHVDRLVTTFDESVGIEQNRRADRERVSTDGPPPVDRRDRERRTLRVVEIGRFAVGRQEQRRGMARTDVFELEPAGVENQHQTRCRDTTRVAPGFAFEEFHGRAEIVDGADHRRERAAECPIAAAAFTP